MTKVLKIIKLENIVERLTAASNPSGMILEVLKILKPENIAERIKASKPSTSSSRITTMEMVSHLHIVNSNVNSNKSKKDNLVLQFLTVAFKLIEFERGLMKLLKQKDILEAHIRSAHEELIYLRALLIDVLRLHTVLNNELHDVLMHAKVTTNKIDKSVLIVMEISSRKLGFYYLRLSRSEKYAFDQFLDASSPYSM
ncbi:hypothetical protein KY285_023940 [Solanum tuberosum]|nr:hypothetical protein KY289_024288 [Solanum tuberosum]KAH0676139.1 hypothetical protein KY285_023940 [Solanum tuberosum]